MKGRLPNLLVFLGLCLSFLSVSSQTFTVSGSQGIPIGGTAALTRVAYGNNVYVTGGSYSLSLGLIYYSTDGTSWQRTTSGVPTDMVFADFVFGNNVYVGVGSDASYTSPKLVYSTDGINWTSVSISGSNSFSRVVFVDGQFWATGKGFMYTSTNGSAWTAVTDADFTTYQLQQLFKVGSTYYIGARDNNGFYTFLFSSTTGASNSWTRTQLFHPLGGSYEYLGPNLLDYVNGRFWMGDTHGYLTVSTNGSSWTDVGASVATITTGGTTVMGKTDPSTGARTQINTAATDGVQTYLYGNFQDLGGYTVAKFNGSTYTVYPRSIKMTGQGLTYINNRFFLNGNEGIASSTDGVTYSYPDGTWIGLAFNGTTYVKVGNTATTEAAISVSTDFTNWQMISGVLQETNLTDVVWGNNQFVAVGSAGKNAVSATGASWTYGSMDESTTFNSIAYGNGTYVAVGISGKISYSTNGTSWTQAKKDATLGTLYGVKYLNNQFIALGGGTNITTGVGTIQTSSDGINWTAVNVNGFLGQFMDVDWDGTNYVLTGRTNEGTTNAQFFTLKTNNISTITPGNVRKLTAAATGGIFLGSIGAGRNSIAYGAGTWVIAANQKSTPLNPYILTSTDGETFTPTAVSNVTNAQPTSILYNGSQFMSVGTRSSMFTVTNSSLPIKLVSFGGRLAGTQHQLFWETALEENALEFQVEQSGNGIDFKPIGSVPVKGSKSSYTYLNRAPVGMTYYRLKMIDKDQQFTYSKVIRLSPTGISLNIYPNPVSGSILHIESDISVGTVRIRNAVGQVLVTKDWCSGQDIDIQTLKSGFYILDIQREDGVSEQTRFLRQ